MLAKSLLRQPCLQKEGESNARRFLCVVCLLFTEPVFLEALLEKEG